MKRLRYVCIAAALAAPVIVIQSGATGTASASGGRLISAGSVTLSGLAGLPDGIDGLGSPEVRAPEADAGEGVPPATGPAPKAESSSVRPAGSEIALTFQGLNHRNNRLANGGNQFSLEPPDQALCVGPTSVLEGVNDVLRVFSKTGAPLTAPISLSEFFNYPPTINRTTGKYGAFITDPVCHFDSDTGRFFFAVLTLDQNADSGDLTGANRLDIAVSATSDPTGAWKLYKLPVQDDGTEGTPNHHCDPDAAPPTDVTNPAACIGDFPHIGADKYGIYLTTNEYSMFSDGSNGGAAYTGAQIYAFSKAQLVSGASSVSVTQFENPMLGQFRSFTVWPAISPAGQDSLDNGGTEYFLSSTLGDGSETGNHAAVENRIGVWAITNTSSIDSASPHLRLSNKLIKADNYTMPPLANQKAGPTPLRDCLNDTADTFGPGVPCGLAVVGVPPASPPLPLGKLNASDTRMNQVVYTDGRLYSALGTGVRVGGSTKAGVLWFNVQPKIERGVLHEAEVKQSGYVGISGNNVTYPAVGVSSSGQVVMAATVTGNNHYPSASYTVINTEKPTVKIISEGVGPQDGFTEYPNVGGNVPRWGDYGAVAMDGGTLWLASESIEQSCTYSQYLTAPIGSCGGTRTALANWSTRVSALQI
ncbi:MAG: hypothetical protein QOC57_2295 [Ilumatobacteraceae bacterium]